MDKKNILKRGIIIGVSLLFFNIAFTPYISVFSKSIDNENMIHLETIEYQDEKTVTCYVFDKKGNNENKVVLSINDYNKFYSIFEELNHKISYEPFSSETEVLKSEFVDLIESFGLIPEGFSRDDIIRLLNPSVNHRRPLLSLVFNPVSKGRGYAFFCNFACFGEGSQFPVIILPRLIPIIQLPIPRAVMHWNAYYGVTSCGGLLSGKGFIAGGPQQGTALGFWGIGFSVFLPPVMTFGFIGYALFATATADEILPWPPNRAPILSGEDPFDGTLDVPIDIPELEFRIVDPDKDHMNYTVTTSPYIGGGSGGNVRDGVFSVDVFGLDSDTEYSWTVRVSDGVDSVEETYSFHTAVEAPIVSDPSPVDGDSWIPVDTSELSFRLDDLQDDPMDYSVETVPDIGSGSGNGVGNGIYYVPISDLDYTREYSWFVNVTDGNYWVRKVFGFKTLPVMVFDPFDEGWSYRKKITIDHSQVAGDFFDFPVLVSIVDSDLASKAQQDGDDVLFMDGSGIATRLVHEIEKYDDTDGELVCWVGVPSLSSSEDTVLYLYYGTSDCGSQEYPHEVWDDNYIGIWHMNDYYASSIIDSTSNNNDGTKNNANEPIETDDGKIAKAQEFDGINDFISTDEILSDGSDFTMSLWINPNIFYNSAAPQTRILNDRGRITIEHGNPLRAGSDAISIRIYDGSQQHFTSFSLDINKATWYYLNGVLDGNNLIFYIDGLLVDSTIGDWTGLNYDSVIGADREQNQYFFEGIIDDVRISNTARTPEWISTCFNTMNNPSNFFYAGPEESAP